MTQAPRPDARTFPAEARTPRAARIPTPGSPAGDGPRQPDPRTPADGPPVHHWPVDHLGALAFDPLLHRLLREEPIARITLRFGEGEAWLATSYEHVRDLSSDPRFSRALTVGRPVTSMTPHTVAPVGGIGRTDPPDHTRLRRLVAQAFSRKRAAELRADAEETARRLVATMVAQGPPADLAEAVTGPMPERLLAGLFGVPAADFGRLQTWREVILSSNHSQEKGDAVKAEIAAYFRGLADLRSRQPGDDLFSELTTLQSAGALSRPELVSLSVMVVLNTLDQIRNQAATMVYALLTHPEQLALLRAEPTLVPRAVEELLRFIPQRNGVGLPRIATEDVAVGDVLIRAGDAVYVSYLAANRDPRVFTEPDRLDVTRDEAPHLAYGNGPHYCLGASLARMEFEVILSTLLRELPHLRPAVPPERVRWRRGSINRGPETLPVAW